MITWTLTEDVVPPGAPAGSAYVEVAGSDEDPHDARYFPNLLTALAFLLNHKCKRGDTIHVEGADTGRILRVGYVRVGDAIEFDVGTRRIPDPASLLDWLSTTIQKGDTVVYLPIESPGSNEPPE